MINTNAVIGTDYTYEYEDRYLRVRLGYVDGMKMIEFYIDNKMIYYKPLRTEDIELKLDDTLIKEVVVEKMRTDKDRWLQVENCLWVINNIEKMKQIERKTGYQFEFEEGNPITVLVVEDKNKRMKLHVSNDKGRGKISCDFDVNLGVDLIDAASTYAKGLVKIAEVFEINRKEIVKPTLSRNIVV